MSLDLLRTVLISVSPALSLQDCEECPPQGIFSCFLTHQAGVWSFPVSLEAVMVGKASFSDIIGPAPEEGVLPSSRVPGENIFYHLEGLKMREMLIFFVVVKPHCCTSWRILVPQPGIEPTPAALEASSLFFFFQH